MADKKDGYNRPITNKGKNLVIPKPTPEEIEGIQSDNDQVRAMSLLNVFGKDLPLIPHDYAFKLKDRKSVEISMQAAYELIGGVPAFALWANENQTEFYKLYARLLPEQSKAQANTQIIINSNIDRNELDNITINGRSLDQPEEGDEDEY